MWEQVIHVLRQAAAANDPALRRGNVVHLPPGAELIIAGDLHGHGDNLLRVEALAGDLEACPNRHVILQELIHPVPEEDGPAGADHSHQVVSRVARWQLRHPGRIHLIIGNHELAQMTGQDILKYGTSLCRTFAESVRRFYGDDGEEVLAAMNDYFRSLPLAARSADGLAVIHSLPADRALPGFDWTVFTRAIQPADRERPGSVYQLLWGRTFTRAAIDRVRQALDARVVVLGHQPQPTGLLVVGDDALVIASDHARGVALRVGPGPVPSARQLAESAIPLASVEPV